MATSATKGVCAVVGVGPGLGASAALKFAREGFKIAGMSRKPETFEPTAAKLKEIGAEYDAGRSRCHPARPSSPLPATVSHQLGDSVVPPINTLVFLCITPPVLQGSRTIQWTPLTRTP